MLHPHASLLIFSLGCDSPSAQPDSARPPASVPLPGSLTAAAWSTAQADIAADARGLHSTGFGTFEADLPRRQRARIGAQGARIGHGGQELVLALTGYGRPGSWTIPAAVEPVVGGCASGAVADACARRVEQPRRGLTEWWVGRGAGLQQGWTLEARPEGEGPLILEVSFEGATAWMEGEEVSLLSPALQASARQTERLDRRWIRDHPRLGVGGLRAAGH